MRLASFVLAGLLSGAAWAVPIASNLTADVVTAGFVGQSFTVVSPGPVNNIVFNFFFDVAATLPSATGVGYLFSAPFIGSPTDLASATTNLLGSVTASSNQWAFDPALVLQSNTQYFFYSENLQGLAGSGSDVYAGGNLYFSLNPPPQPPGDNFISVPTQDWAFLVDGTLLATGVPEVDAGATRLPLASVFCMMALALSGTLPRRTRPT